MPKINKVVKKNWDEIGIAMALGNFYTSRDNINIEEHGYIIEALRRSQSELEDADIPELQAYVHSLDEEQLPGLISNIKGIAHEIHYVEVENENGDTIKAHIFESTNHEKFDVILYDKDGPIEELQLKATDSIAYANEAIESVGKEQVVLTEELAQKMGVQSSGITNAELKIAPLCQRKFSLYTTIACYKNRTRELKGFLDVV